MTETFEQPVEPQVRRLVRSKKIQIQIDGAGRLNETLPSCALSLVNAREGLYDVIVRGKYLSERGNLHPQGYTERFRRNHHFSLPRAEEKAVAYLFATYSSDVAENITESLSFSHQVVTEVFSTVAENSPFSDFTFIVTLDEDRGGYAIKRRWDQRYLSKNGEWHRLGSTRRFKRNHYFTYDEAVERTLALFPTLTAHEAPYEGMNVQEAEAKYAQFQSEGRDFYGRDPYTGYSGWSDDEDEDEDYNNDY